MTWNVNRICFSDTVPSCNVSRNCFSDTVPSWNCFSVTTDTVTVETVFFTNDFIFFSNVECDTFCENFGQGPIIESLNSDRSVVSYFLTGPLMPIFLVVLRFLYSERSGDSSVHTRSWIPIFCLVHRSLYFERSVDLFTQLGP